MINSLEDLIDVLQDEEGIYIYGAGVRGKCLLHALQKNGIEVLGFLVSEMGENPEAVEGKRVYSMTEDDTSRLKNSCVIIGFAGNISKAMDFLLHQGFKKVIKCINEIDRDLIKTELQIRCNSLNDGMYTFGFDCDKDEIGHGVLIDSNGERRFRFCAERLFDLKHFYELKYLSQASYERQYGKYQKLPVSTGAALSDAFMKENKFEIFAATGFKDKVSYEGTGLIPIQIGATFTDGRHGYITDDTGDNISYKNKNYSECTALYWIWKNTCGQDYVGLCHYRRRFELYEESINYIKENKIDAVTTLPQYIDATVKEFFLQFIMEYDWEIFKSSVSAYDKSYKRLFEIYENSHFFVVCNLGIMTRAWFDRYCEFAFSVAERIENEYSGVIRQDRYMGFLFENMLSFFIMIHHEEMNIVCTNMVFLK